MAWRNYHENSLTDHYEIADVTIDSNIAHNSISVNTTATDIGSYIFG